MSEPKNPAALDAFQIGQRSYSINSKAELERSLDSFEMATKIDSACARAWSGIAYNLVQLWLQGWAGKEVLERAESCALQGVQLDADDHFTQSYLGFYYLHTGRSDLAMKAYEAALDANDDDRTVFADAAEAFIYVGRIDEGIKLLERARRVPDWHRWDLAWAYYLKGREDPACYDLALQELAQLFYKPGDPKYAIDIDLLYAAIYARKGDSGNAATCLARFQAGRPNWTADDERRSTAFTSADDLAHWLEGVGAAGLPGPSKALSQQQP